MRSLQKSDVSQPSVQASETPAQRRQRGHWLDALAASATRARRLAGVAVALSGVLLLVQSAAIAWLVQAVLVQHLALAQLRNVGAGLLVALIGRALLNAWAQSLTGEVADVAKRELRARIARRLVQHGPLWLRRQRSGELGELSLAHTDALEGYFVGYQLARIEMLLVPPLILIAVFYVDWVVGLVLLLTAPLIPFFMMLVGWGAEAAGREQLGELARMGGHFADRLKGLGLLRVYGRGQAELQGIAAAAEGVRERSLNVLRIAFLSSTVLEFFASVSVAIVALYFGLSYLGMLHLHGLPSLGAGMFCLLLAPEFFAPLRRLAAHYHDRANALAAVAEAERLLQGFQPPAAAQIAALPARALEPAQAHAPLLQARGLALRPAGAPPAGGQGVCADAGAWAARCGDRCQRQRQEHAAGRARRLACTRGGQRSRAPGCAHRICHAAALSVSGQHCRQPAPGRPAGQRCAPARGGRGGPSAALYRALAGRPRRGHRRAWLRSVRWRRPAA